MQNSYILTLFEGLIWELGIRKWVGKGRSERIEGRGKPLIGRKEWRAKREWEEEDEEEVHNIYKCVNSNPHIKDLEMVGGGLGYVIWRTSTFTSFYFLPSTSTNY